MVRTVTAQEAEKNFRDVLGHLAADREPVVVEDRGEPVAVVISPDDFARFRRDREADGWAVVRELREANADKDPDEVYEDITRIVEEVRQEMHDERQRARSGRR
jgi:prevent-host-death family protein